MKRITRAAEGFELQVRFLMRKSVLGIFFFAKLETLAQSIPPRIKLSSRDLFSSQRREMGRRNNRERECKLLQEPWDRRCSGGEKSWQSRDSKRYPLWERGEAVVWGGFLRHGLHLLFSIRASGERPNHFSIEIWFLFSCVGGKSLCVGLKCFRCAPVSRLHCSHLLGINLCDCHLWTDRESDTLLYSGNVHLFLVLRKTLALRTRIHSRNHKSYGNRYFFDRAGLELETSSTTIRACVA